MEKKQEKGQKCDSQNSSQSEAIFHCLKRQFINNKDPAWGKFTPCLTKGAKADQNKRNIKKEGCIGKFQAERE